jgi:hypothetical protein
MLDALLLSCSHDPIKQDELQHGFAMAIEQCLELRPSLLVSMLAKVAFDVSNIAIATIHSRVVRVFWSICDTHWTWIRMKSPRLHITILEDITILESFNRMI